MLTVRGYMDVAEMQLKQREAAMTGRITRFSEDTTSTTTCRCLFGPVDRADNDAVLASLRASLDRLNAARWGYDFAAGRPLPGGQFEWTEVDCRRSAHSGNDVRDRAALQQDDSETTTSSSEFVTSSPRWSSPPMKRRRHAVTPSQRRRREIARFDDVIRHVVVCTPASQQHHNARYRRHVITGSLHARSRNTSKFLNSLYSLLYELNLL